MSCKSSALCLFDEQDVQTDITGTVITDYHPVHTLTAGGPIEFLILGTGDEYIDLGDLRLLVRLKIIKKDGKAWNSTADKVNFVNLPLSSIFQDVFMSINDTQVEGGQHLYPYNGYISTLLQFHPSAKQTHLQAWGWNEDTPGKFNDDKNEGLKFRRAETDSGKVWEIMGPLFLDLTRQPRYLLPHTNLRLKLLPATSEFALQSTGSYDDFKFSIEKCVLYAPRISVLNSVVAGHNKGLEKFNAQYHLNHVDITTFNLEKGNRSFIKDGLFKSQVPKMIVVGLLDHAAFNGNIKKSPFNFKHYNLNKIGLYRDGELTPGQIFTPDYANDHFTRSYNHTMDALNYFNTDDSNGMTMEHFKDGYNLYAFDLTPDGSNQGQHRHLIRSGSVRLELNFEKVLSKPITVMLFGILDAKLEITKLREVIMSYSR